MKASKRLFAKSLKTMKQRRNYSSNNQEKLTFRYRFEFGQTLLHLRQMDGVSTALLMTLSFTSDPLRVVCDVGSTITRSHDG